MTSNGTGKKKICVVVQSRANYARIKSFLSAAQRHPGIDLQVILGAAGLLDRFGNLRSIMEKDGFTINAKLFCIVEGENPTTMAKSTGLGIIELATQFENLKPDLVLTVADRFETMATAIAACYMNIPLAHTQGGEVTGSIDESVRHAITKMAHIHFPATRHAADNVIRMGEDPATVHWVGCPSIDLVADLDLRLPNDFFEKHLGVGQPIDPSKPYLVVLQHPVTTEYGQGIAQINETLKAVHNLEMQTVWLWPNIDAGSDDISKGLRSFREQNKKAPIQFYKNFTPENYAILINNCACLLGNSSSALREGAFLGVPAVNIGSRQQGREHAENVRHAPYIAEKIEAEVRALVRHGHYPSSDIFGRGDAGQRIADILATANPSVQKRLFYDVDPVPKTDA